MINHTLAQSWSVSGGKYFFILGSNPTLSLAELAAVFNYGKLSLIQKNIAILESGQEINVNILKSIGGTVKFGRIYGELNAPIAKDIIKSAINQVKPEAGRGKFNFGISYYGTKHINLKVLGMEFKNALKQSGQSSRWVTSREETLSSVVVEQNRLTTDRGMEIALIQFDKKLLIGKTLAVQPFKELSFRDYGRPARDDRSGMLPPKLAQIMINLSGAEPNETILDPFCGSGTILTEAMLMGYHNIVGSDISAKAIEDTKKNIKWIIENWKLKIGNLELLLQDVCCLSQKIKPQSIGAIITEPYLGPQRGQLDILKTAKELETLYGKSLKEFKKILNPGGRVIMVWPTFYSGRKNIFLNPDTAGFKIVNPMPLNLQKNIFVKLTERNSIVYGREQQKVWREIVILCL